MTMRPDTAIQFILNGRRYALRREGVESRLTGIVPEVIHKHAVRINETWFPVMQAFEAATGTPRSEFISHTARRHLAALGFHVAGKIEPRASSRLGDAPRTPLVASGSDTDARTAAGEWHTEANVQAALVTALASDGWHIMSVANTATKERGVDVIAAREGKTMGVEVKGFPSRSYADPARAGEPKRTAPSTQAGHWFAQAVLAAMRLRSKEPAWRSVIALPDFGRYRDLYAETAGSLTAASIELWWVDQSGGVRPA